MTRVFEGDVWVAYGQAYVLDGEDQAGDLNECFGGQANGLCGAAQPGMLVLITGLHTGDVPFAVDVLDTAPPDDDAGDGAGWEDVVEVSLAVTATRTDPNLSWCSSKGAGDPVEIVLAGWGGGSVAVIPLPAAGDYRVRYSTTGMDAGHDQDTRRRGEPITERHLLQLWPAPPALDAVLRRTSANAAFWHDHARSLPPPPTPEERTEAARLAEQQAQQEQAARAEAFEIASKWAGRAPTPRLREVGDVATTMAHTDRDLLDQVAELDPTTQRGAAHWLAHRAYRHAGLDTQDWARAGLDALAHDQPLPPPFTADGDLTEAFALAVALDPWPGWTPAPTHHDVPGAAPGGEDGPTQPTEQATAYLTVDSLPPPSLRPQTPSPRSSPPPSRPNQPRRALPRSTASSTTAATGHVAPLDGSQQTLQDAPASRGVHRPAMALPALPAATATDPLRALLDTYHHAQATFDHEGATLIAELRDHLARSTKT